MISKLFDTWLARQFEQGLTDLRLTVLSGSKATADAIKAELLNAESLLAEGLVRAAPTATSHMPENVRDIINNTSM